jgi:antitoxin HigA-1
MPMKNPPHPGEIVRDICMDALNLSVTEAASGLGVTRKTLSMFLNGHSGMSPEMAIRLSRAFGRSPHSWLMLQSAYDLAQAMRHANKIKVKPFSDSASQGHA